MANVTLSIDDDLLARGRNYAAARGTSLNALIRQLLEESTSRPEAAVDEIMGRLRAVEGNSHGRKIKREELHRH